MSEYIDKNEAVGEGYLATGISIQLLNTAMKN